MGDNPLEEKKRLKIQSKTVCFWFQMGELEEKGHLGLTPSILISLTKTQTEK